MSAYLDTQDRFLALLETHRGILYKISRAFGRSADDRDDLIQETVLQLWRAFPRYDPQFKFSTWMYRIALNVAISWQRREQTRGQRLVAATEEVLALTPAPEPSSEDEHVSLLYRLIERLDPLNRALLVLYLEGQSHKEISGVLGIPPSNVGTRIGRLKDRLREHFRAAGHLPEKDR